MLGPRDKSEKQIPTSSLSMLKESKEKIIHIINAGPGMRNFDWQIIRGKDIMTINDSIFYLPLKVTYHIYNEPIDRERERYEKMTKQFHYVKKFTTFNYKNWHQLNLYDDKNLAFMLAINLAIDLGYQEARLYGYDFDCIRGYVHWWDKKPETDNKIIKEKKKLIYKQKDLFKDFKLKTQDKIILREIKAQR